MISVLKRTSYSCLAKPTLLYFDSPIYSHTEFFLDFISESTNKNAFAFALYLLLAVLKVEGLFWYQHYIEFTLILLNNLTL